MDLLVHYQCENYWYGYCHCSRCHRRAVLVCRKRRHSTVQRRFGCSHALLAARARGVDLKILVPGRYHDQPAVRRASRRTWRPLLEGGVELYEYEPTMIHCKIVIVDSSVTSIGSINFDPRSFALNAEFGVVTLDRALAKQIEDAFVDDLRSSRRVTPEDLSRLSIGERLLNIFCYWIRAQL